MKTNLTVRRTRKLTTIYLDNAVIDWFNINDGNLSGTINRLMCSLVQHCQSSPLMKRRVLNAGKKLYYKIEC